MNTDKPRVPKKGDRVIALGQKGAFIVIAVFEGIQKANLKLIGREDFVLKGIPWVVLSFLDQEPASQVATRIVREASGDESN